MYKSKKILAIVPARGGSKGIPKKNLKKIHGKSLVQIVGECIKKTRFIDSSVITSDSDQILNEGYKYGLQKIKRPLNLSGDNVSDIPVLINAMIAAEKLYQIKFDFVVMLQPTSPLRKVKHVENTIKKIVDEDLDSVWTVHEVDNKYHPDKQLEISKKKLKYYSRNGEKIVARQELSKTFIKNGICYGISRQQLLKKKKLLGIKNGFIIIKGTLVNIDDLSDLKLAKKLLKNHSCRI